MTKREQETIDKFLLKIEQPVVKKVKRHKKDGIYFNDKHKIISELLSFSKKRTYSRVIYRMGDNNSFRNDARSPYKIIKFRFERFTFKYWRNNETQFSHSKKAIT